MSVVFTGFHSPEVGRTTKLYNVEIVEQGLRNHFNTKKGERVMDTEYGFIAWDLMFELDTTDYSQTLTNDAIRIISLEPRVRLLNIDVVRIPYGYHMSVLLDYVELNTQKELEMIFDARTNARLG